MLGIEMPRGETCIIHFVVAFGCEANGERACALTRCLGEQPRHRRAVRSSAEEGTDNGVGCRFAYAFAQQRNEILFQLGPRLFAILGETHLPIRPSLQQAVAPDYGRPRQNAMTPNVYCPWTGHHVKCT